MDPHFYKVLHLSGIFLLFLSLGAFIMKEIAAPDDKRFQRFIFMNHGIALIIILVAGFGKLAANMSQMASGWVLVKMLVWLVMATVVMLIHKVPKLRLPMFYVVWGFGILAAYMAVFKPF